MNTKGYYVFHAETFAGSIGVVISTADADQMMQFIVATEGDDLAADFTKLTRYGMDDYGLAVAKEAILRSLFANGFYNTHFREPAVPIKFNDPHIVTPQVLGKVARAVGEGELVFVSEEKMEDLVVLLNSSRPPERIKDQFSPGIMYSIRSAGYSGFGPHSTYLAQQKAKKRHSYYHVTPYTAMTMAMLSATTRLEESGEGEVWQMPICLRANDILKVKGAYGVSAIANIHRYLLSAASNACDVESVTTLRELYGFNKRSMVTVRNKEGGSNSPFAQFMATPLKSFGYGVGAGEINTNVANGAYILGIQKNLDGVFARVFLTGKALKELSGIEGVCLSPSIQKEPVKNDYGKRCDLEILKGMWITTTKEISTTDNISAINPAETTNFQAMEILKESWSPFMARRFDKSIGRIVGRLVSSVVGYVDTINNEVSELPEMANQLTSEDCFDQLKDFVCEVIKENPIGGEDFLKVWKQTTEKAFMDGDCFVSEVCSPTMHRLIWSHQTPSSQGLILHMLAILRTEIYEKIFARLVSASDHSAAIIVDSRDAILCRAATKTVEGNETVYEFKDLDGVNPDLIKRMYERRYVKQVRIPFAYA